MRAAKAASDFAAILDRMDENTRESVLNILWFYYVGHRMDWWHIYKTRRRTADHERSPL